MISRLDESEQVFLYPDLVIFEAPPVKRLLLKYGHFVGLLLGGPNSTTRCLHWIGGAQTCEHLSEAQLGPA